MSPCLYLTLDEKCWTDQPHETLSLLLLVQKKLYGSINSFSIINTLFLSVVFSHFLVNSNCFQSPLPSLSFIRSVSLYCPQWFLYFFPCCLCYIVLQYSTQSLSLLLSGHLSYFFPSFSICMCVYVCVCWIDCTSGYIFCPHFCSLPLASPSHSSLECRPSVGYYCLIKGRMGRRRPDKSIKLPLAVPEGRWIEMDFVPAREYPRVHLFQMVSDDV